MIEVITQQTQERFLKKGKPIKRIKSVSRNTRIWEIEHMFCVHTFIVSYINCTIQICNNETDSKTYEVADPAFPENMLRDIDKIIRRTANKFLVVVCPDDRGLRHCSTFYVSITDDTVRVVDSSTNQYWGYEIANPEFPENMFLDVAMSINWKKSPTIMIVEAVIEQAQEWFEKRGRRISASGGKTPSYRGVPFPGQECWKIHSGRHHYAVFFVKYFPSDGIFRVNGINKAWHTQAYEISDPAFPENMFQYIEKITRESIQKDVCGKS